MFMSNKYGNVVIDSEELKEETHELEQVEQDEQEEIREIEDQEWLSHNHTLVVVFEKFCLYFVLI